MPDYDVEQQSAVTSLGRNILVSASAGAGKTRVLVARLTKRVQKDHVRLSEILALTFTEAAAAEMKKRMADSLHKAYEEETDTEEKEWLKAQLIELEAADITTIDSYCMTIVKKYYSVIGLNPLAANNVLSSGNSTIMKHNAFTLAFHDLYTEDAENALRLSEYFSARSEDYSSLEKTVDKINTHAQSSIDPNVWYDNAKNSYQHIFSLKDLPIEVTDQFYQYLAIRIQRIESMLNQMDTYAQGDEKLIESTKEKHIAVLNCMHALEEKNYTSYCSALDQLALTETTANGKNKDYTKIRTKMEKKVKDALAEKYPESILVQDHNDLTSVCASLVSLSQHTQEYFQEEKIKSAVIDFTDMERYAYQILLANDNTVAHIIMNSFKEITVDEFQDTSELQNAIIDQISNGKNTFRVGDVKQSIYRFRQAKPQLMRGLMIDPDTEQITLKHNYRSKNSIVEFSNHLFDKLMNIDGTKDCYSEEDTVSIGTKGQKEEIVPVKFTLLYESLLDEMQEGGEEDNSTEEEESPSSKGIKANWIATKILSMMQEDNSLSYHDFSILFRNHADKLYLRSAFDQYNIPYSIDAREGFYHSDLCQTIFAAVRFMMNQKDDISLLALMTSELYRIPDIELAQIKLHAKSFYQGVKDTHPEIFAEMHHLRDVAYYQGITEMLKQLSLLHDFYNRLNHSQKANFDYLFEMTCVQKIDTLRSFLDILEAGQDEKSSEASATGKDDDVVTVTTIHQSKGLQYPIVILWSTSKNPNMEKRDTAIVDDDLYIGLKHLSLPYREKRTTVQRIAVDQKSDLEDIEEYIRVLYVAVTRAEKRLFVVDTTRDDYVFEDVNLALLSARTGMTGLIMNAMKEDPLFSYETKYYEKGKELPPLSKKYVSALPALSIEPEIFKPIMTPSETEFTILPTLDSNSKLSGTRYGTRIHEAAEALPNTVWSLEDMKDLDIEENDKKKLIAFAESYLYQKALTMEIHKEYPFYVENEEERLIGTMDFVAVDETEVLLIDFKTDNASYEEIQKRYSNQLNTYRKALKYLYPGRKIEVYAWSFHNTEAILIVE